MWGNKFITTPGQLIAFERNHGNTGFNINIWARQHPAAAALIGVTPPSNTKLKGSGKKVSTVKKAVGAVAQRVVPGAVSGRPVAVSSNGRITAVSGAPAKAVSSVANPVAKKTPNPISDVLSSAQQASKSASVNQAKGINNAPSVPKPLVEEPNKSGPTVIPDNARVIVRSGKFYAQ